MSSPSLTKAYRPEEHEPRIWQKWVRHRSFAADPARVLFAGATPYTILIPPPNVTAALHLGHALNNSLQDVLARVHRMKGYETLWMPGTDHAGIATQTVVEKRVLAEEGKRRTDFPRNEFVARIQTFKDEYEQRITDQLKALGCSCDWDRQRFTMDPICARAVREAFFRLFQEGLIYRGKRLVNWDPVTQTALADDEVEMTEVQGSFYYLRYPLVHPPTNPDDPKDAQEVTWSELAARGFPSADQYPEDDPAWVTVATTRPETYIGDTAVALNPADPRAPALRGLMVQLPIIGRIIPIVTDDYVVMPARFPWQPEREPDDQAPDPKAHFATGFLKVTPAHDPNDYELGRRHNLEAINVMAPDASISESHGWDRAARNEGGHIFVGKSREDARKLVIKEFQVRALLEGIKPYTHSVGHSYRSHAAIEPYLSDQWYVKVSDDQLRGQAQRALPIDQRTTESLNHWPDSNPASSPSDGSLTFYPARYAKTYESWHDNLRDWCISRQLWWGHQIPVWTSSTTQPITTGANPSQTEQIDGVPVKFQFLDDAQHELIHVTRFAKAERNSLTTTVQVCIAPNDQNIEQRFIDNGFTQDPDVLDTWFSSALWPLSTLGWPNDDLPIVMPHQLDPRNFRDIHSVYLKRVGTWKNFIGKGDDAADQLVERLLHLRDFARTDNGTSPISYQFFSESTLHELGYKTTPLTSPDDIATATDLVCAVGLRTTEPVQTAPFGPIDLRHLLLSHNFVNTAGLLAAFNPTNVLCTAREIITLWVSRMVMFNRFFLDDSAGSPPFRDVFIHAMIQDGEGRKMSKSLGNGVDPLDIIHSHGADAMRFTLVQMTTQTQDVRMPVERDPQSNRNTSPKFDIGRNFCNKLWNAARFALSNLETTDSTSPTNTPIDPASLSLADRWMLARVAQTLREVDAALASYQFSTYAQLMYDLLWRDFCDWYLEAIKPTIRESAAQQACLRATLDSILRMLHPITPFITEAIYEQVSTLRTAPITALDLGETVEDAVLCTSAWPQADDALLDLAAVSQFDRLRELVTTIREVRSQHSVQPKRRVTLHLDSSLAADFTSAASLLEVLAGLDSITPDAPSSPAVPFTFDGRELHLSNLADSVDTAAEHERLTKQRVDLEKSVTALTTRLSNPGYADRAPAHLVEQTRAQLARAQADLDAVLQSLERLA
ncbi:MAG: valine--tRNA ligase [Phycisphaeraceae bacterium]|nr:valine--tRNA ligase [Phycisphaeraceae bacterium]MCW5762343.1 valine--tRNA ligase [Phycisphaeraceae bacterium]